MPHTCLNSVKDLSEELDDFVRENCMSRHGDDTMVAEAYQAIKKLFDRSEEDRLKLQRDNEELLKRAARRQLRTDHESTDEEASRIRTRIDMLKQDLIAKQVLIEQLRTTQESQIRRLEAINREEVQGLRESLSLANRHIDKWKSMYSEDVSRLRAELNQRATEIESFSSRRLCRSTLAKTRPLTGSC